MKKGMALAFVGFFGALLVLSTFGPATAQDPAGPEGTLPRSLSTPTVAPTKEAEATARPTEGAVFLGPLPSMPAKGTPTPEPAGTEPDILPAEPRPVPEGQTVPQKEGLSTAGEIWVWTDRGCGPSAVYDPGDPITFYFQGAQSGSATLYYHRPDGTQVLWSGYMDANVTYYIPTQIASDSPGGVRILRILMAGALAQDYCGFSIRGGVGNFMCGVLHFGDIGSCTSMKVYDSCYTSESYIWPFDLPSSPGEQLLYIRAVVVYNPQIGWNSWCGAQEITGFSSYEVVGYQCSDCPAGGAGEIHVWTNKGYLGCDGTFRVGEGITIYVEAAQSGYAWLYNYWPDGNYQIISLGYLQRDVTYYLTGTVGGPEGRKVLRVVMPDATAQDYCSFIVEEQESTPIIVPTDGMCRVTWVDQTSNNCSGDFGLHSPQRMLLFSDYRQRPSPIYKDIGPYSQGTELVFYIQPGPPCGGEYLSTSQNARVTQPDSNTYRIEWEDLPPGQGDDWNDLVVDVQCGITTCPSDQWRGEYYNNRDLQGSPVHVQCDQRIDFYWGTGSPHNSVPADNFSVRWERTVEFPETGWYRFRTFTDDGLRLYIDGRREINDWGARSFAERSEVIQLSQGPHRITMEYQEYAGDAMAHLTWYRCPNGEGDCNVDIVPMYQTKYPDLMVEGCPTHTIKRFGCLITSYAMALRKLGVITDPAELNDWLKREGGYVERDQNGECDANLKSKSYINKFVVTRTNGLYSLHFEVINSLNKAKDKIRAGRPVIMFDPDVSHFFLAVDVANIGGNETLGINDPVHAWGPILRGSLNHRTTLRDDGYNNAKFRDSISLTTQAPSASLRFNGKGAEMLLTDAQGRRVGYDAATGQVVQEIPNSFYYDSKIVPPGGESDGVEERTLFLPRDAGGSYTLQAVNPYATASDLAASSFQITIVGLDAQFNPTEATISGAIQPGSVATFDVTFSPGQEIEVTPHCPGDANGDGVVNAVDLSILASEWGRNCNQQSCRADFNQDGIVNAVDLSILAANWGKRCS